jgi:hypothetical protein
MKANHIELIKSAAIKLEKKDMQMAHDLMSLANKQRPNGPFIKKKLEEYKVALSNIKLNELFDSGELAIIPAGFRCQTKAEVTKFLGLKQVSFPFDSGFFPPNSVANIIINRKIELKYPDQDNKTHRVCIKLNKNYDDIYGFGIKFITSSYEDINNYSIDKNSPDINKYLDSTFGYYTLDVSNRFVLAHYNWHKYSDVEKSKGIYDTKENIENLNLMLNKRIERMFQICDDAKYVIFTLHNPQGFRYMAIDDEIHNLNDLVYLNKVVKERFGAKALVIDFSEINSAKKLIEKLKLS